MKVVLIINIVGLIITLVGLTVFLIKYFKTDKILFHTTAELATVKAEKFEQNMKNVLEIEKKSAVEGFAERVKGKLQDFGDGGERGAYITEKDIYELLKEFLK